MANKSLNKVVLMGNLTRDPELKYTPTGTAVCTIGLATNRTWTSNTGEAKEEVQFHRVIAWQKLAELCGKLLTKGRRIYLEGRLVYRSYVGKDGQQKNITEIIMSDFILFDDKFARESDAGASTTPTTQPVADTTDYSIDPDLDSAPADIEEASKETTAPAGTSSSSTTETLDNIDDDIPF